MITNSKTSLPLQFLLTTLIIAVTETSAITVYKVSCTSNKTFTPNSTFHTNLNTLLSSLSSNATNNLRFSNATAGKEDSDTVYGLYMCRGDVPFSVCIECVDSATHDIASNCPTANEAVIWLYYRMKQGSNDGYAVKQENVSGSVTLYGFAQCTPDLFAGDCHRCVVDAAAEYPKVCCGGNIGASVFFQVALLGMKRIPSMISLQQPRRPLL
ncbi:hypothetical protein RJT34_25266 [Clitoria ternatea]|uniref:Gnk2-homologous domain-containing protein n=1 Tax=Clitoria ternatea TaxID=43366 RepID=A0AAN9FRI6_CLITE